MDRDLKRLVVVATSGFVSIMMAANVFFVKRLVDQIDATNKLVMDLQQQVVVLNYQIETLKERKELKKI